MEVEGEKRPVGVYFQVHEIQFQDDWLGKRVGQIGKSKLFTYFLEVRQLLMCWDTDYCLV